MPPNGVRGDVDAGAVLPALKMLPALVFVCGPPFLAGLSGRRLWGWLWVLGFLGIAVKATLDEHPNYDMPGFGMRLFGAAAALAALALGAGSCIRRLKTHRAGRA
jgi:hypothetical protein